MVIRGKASLRVSFGGGSTDVAPFYEERGGAIIGSTINKYVYCSIAPREGDQIVVRSLDFGMTVRYNTRENYVYDRKLDLVTMTLNAVGIDQDYEVYPQCDTPPGSGLGTSSTVMVTMLTAMVRWEGVMMDAYTLAGLAYQMERLDLKTDGRYQDQYATTFGGFNFIEFRGRNDVVVNPLRIKKDIIHELQYGLLLRHTRKIHISANIIKDQVQNYEKKGAFEAMCEVKALACVLRDELLKGNLHSFNKLLDYGWQSRRHISSKITNSQIGRLYDEALKAGALGGKLLGAGGGGYLLIYCPYSVRHKVAACMEQADRQPVDWGSELRDAQSWVANESRRRYDQMKIHMPNGKYRFNI